MAEKPSSLWAFSSATVSSIWILSRLSTSKTHEELAYATASTATLTACGSCGSTCETAASTARPPSPKNYTIVSLKLRKWSLRRG